MSETQIQALANAAKSDSALAERLNATADFEAFLTIAKEAGFTVTKADLQAVAGSEQLGQEELSDEQLEEVAGGGFWSSFKKGWITMHGWWYIPVKAGIERKDINEAAKGTGL